MTRTKRKDAPDAVAAAPKRSKKDESELLVPVETAAAEAVAAVEQSKPPPKKRAPVKASNQSPAEMMADFDHYLFQLLAFKADAGNFHVAKDEYPDLHAFLQLLKKEYKNATTEKESSPLTAEQIKVLEFLHVPLTSRGDDHWNRFYDLLKQYGERHGHVLVPRLCEIPGLGDWVTDQRRQYKAFRQGQTSQLTKERREKLEALGFAWQVRNRPEWDQRFQQLLEYKAVHGDCKVPQHYKENKALGKWVAKQREQYKVRKGNLLDRHCCLFSSHRLSFCSC